VRWGLWDAVIGHDGVFYSACTVLSAPSGAGPREPVQATFGITAGRQAVAAAMKRLGVFKTRTAVSA